MLASDHPQSDVALDRKVRRRLPVGAEVLPEGGFHFRVWAPRRHAVDLVFDIESLQTVRLAVEGDGYFSGFVGEAGPSTLYRFALDRDDQPVPDPASRFRPRGPHGPSEARLHLL